MKTSEANLEFSYDSQYRAEVARKTGNIVDFGTTVSIKPGLTSDCSQIENNLLRCSLHCLFCPNRCNGRPGVAEIERIGTNPAPKKKPPEGGFSS
ncbi:hypothetical protein [Paraburkholderia youngii]|uniref:hypothetical protein n=1 Tax=Paraburkholderia youngii TaxID=2782701 RepID=UPI0015916D4E|nr:hypothetical protein [Paraburkholderia youngii]NUX54949.1 hypothetical protein [Paraburkholderia youngii]